MRPSTVLQVWIDFEITMKRFRELLKRWCDSRPKDAASVRDATLRLHAKYQKVFGSEDGQDVLADIMKRNGCYDSILGDDAQQTAHKEGQRYAAMSIFRFTEKDPQELQRQNENPDESKW